MAGLAPVGVKQTRVSRASRSAMPVKASLGSNFTAGGRVDFNGQQLSLGVAPGSRKAGSRCVTSMAAKVAGYIKLAIEAGKANPAPPIGPALGAKVRCPDRHIARTAKTSDAVPSRGENASRRTPPADATPRLGTRKNTSGVRARVHDTHALRALARGRRRPLASPRAPRPLRRNPKPSRVRHVSRLTPLGSLFLAFFPHRRRRQGVNIMMFCKEYNARTADQPGMIIPVEITVFEDKSFTFVLKTPPASVLLKKAAGITKGSAQLEKVGSITKEQLAEIATLKMPDFNSHKVESAMRIVAGTAANMGITIDGWDMETSQREFREEKAALYNMNPDDLKIA